MNYEQEVQELILSGSIPQNRPCGGGQDEVDRSAKKS
jgi:hypothetical protein